jgi:hypothetical protein
MPTICFSLPTSFLLGLLVQVQDLPAVLLPFRIVTLRKIVSQRLRAATAQPLL